MTIRRWLKDRQHLPGARPTLDLVQLAYDLARRRLAGDVPAVAGGWPVRLVPMPAPRPITRSELRTLRRADWLRGASFFDGRAVQDFEHRMGELWGCEHVLAVSSGTAALHTAMMAGGIGPGDEVIVPVMTYVATALAVMQAGATPCFVDAHPDTWNADPELVERAVTERTKAIVPMHVGGVPCHMEALRRIADRHGLLVIEDAAHAHGSSLDGRWLGTLGHIGCFSFGPPKTITTGEGGALLTNDPELAQRARMAMCLGECAPDGQHSAGIDFSSPETRLDYRMVGWNYRMSVAQAMLGLGQLERFDRIRRARIENGAHLRGALAGVEGIEIQRVPDGAVPCYYTFPTALAGDAPLGRGELLAGLARERIDFRLWSNLPLAAYDVFGRPGRFPVAERICAGFIGLRVDPVLGRRDMQRAVDAIRRLLAWGERERSPVGR